MAGCLVFVGACQAQDDDFFDNPPFGEREIDKLPKSKWALSQERRSWNEPATGHEFHLALYPKDTYRCGATCLEQLCVIEAWCPEDESGPATLVLSDHMGAELWREEADWLWSNQRMRARWLPVWRGRPGHLSMQREGETLAACEANLDSGLGGWFEVQAEQPVDPINAGIALVPKWITLAEDSEVRVAFTTSLPPVAELAVTAEFTSAGGAARPPSGWRQGSQNGARVEFAMDADEPGTLTVTAQDAGRELASLTHTILPVKTRPPESFGARKQRLDYLAQVRIGEDEWAPWEEVWQGQKQTDVVTDFPGRPVHLVFWRGCSYVPCWAFGDAWLTHEWLEAEPDFYGAEDCVEPLMDKDCTYSNAEIAASTPARAVVRWTYRLVDLNVKWVREEHAEEIYTIYPDGIGTRRLLAFIQPGWHENQEFIAINRPGARPWEALDFEAMTFLSTAGDREEVNWPLPRLDVDRWPDIIARVNMRNAPDVFQVSNDDYPTIKTWGEPYVDDPEPDRHRKPDIFNWYPHWPVTRNMRTSWVDDPARCARQPTHSNLVNIVDTYLEKHDDCTEWLWLIGVAPEDEERLRAVAANWLRPGELRVLSGGLEPDGYSQRDRAWRLRAPAPARRARLRLTAPEGHALVNPAVIIEGWQGGAEVETRPPADRVCIGREGDALVIWIEGTFARRLRLRVTPER